MAMKTPTKPRRPTLAEAGPEYARLTEKAEALRSEEAALKSERSKLLAEVAAATHDGGDRAARVQAELGSVTGDAPEIKPVGSRTRLESINTRLGDIAALLDALRLPIVNARMKASAEVCKAVKDEHTSLVREMAKAFVALHAAHAAYGAFADDLNREGVAWSQLGPMQPHWLGDPRSNQCRVALFLREAVRAGFIGASDVPSELR